MTSLVYWTPVNRGLPTDPEMPVLVAINCDTWIATYDGKKWRDLDGMPLAGVSHWGDMPMLDQKTGERTDD
jgi:hypothetical protein